MTEQTLTEQLMERRELKPDKYTLAWWEKRFDEIKQGYIGANHNINNAVACARDCWAEIKAQRATIATQDEELEALRALNGELQGELVTLRDRVDKMANWINEQRGK